MKLMGLTTIRDEPLTRIKVRKLILITLSSQSYQNTLKGLYY